MIEIEITNRQSSHDINEVRLESAVRAVLDEEGISAGSVSIAVVDDTTIHQLNRRWLQHDWATDVLSFALERGEGYLEGDVVVSADTAAATARRYDWSTADELLLYVLHGTLHLVGYDDTTPQARAEMREQERRYLAGFNLTPRYDEDEKSSAHANGGEKR